MNKLLKELIIRQPTVDDAQTTLDLIIACDIAEYGDPDSSLDDLLHEWTQINLHQDAWLVFTPDNKLIGYAAVFKNNTDFPFDFYTHPTYNEDNLREHLLVQCEARAYAQLTDVHESTGGITTTIISGVNGSDRQVLEAAGYKPRKYYFRMQKTLDTLSPISVWPENCELRTIIANQDDQIVYDFIQKAFEQPGRIPQPFDSWCDYMMRPDHFEDDLWFLLFYEDELIGAALCYDYTDYGWVRQLGVAPSWRGQGLGSALLQYAFNIFFQRGHKKVALGVDSDRPKAYSLYENVGMACVRRYDEYYKVLGSSIS